MGVVAETIERKLAAALSPSRLELRDESHLHHGHAGYNPEGESHFRLTVVSSRFEGLSRVERQRLVLQILAEEMKGRVHALSIKALTEKENT